MTMNPELKQKWIEALRSGDYKQTKEKLRRWGGYCCLGVLCEVAKPKGWNGHAILIKDLEGEDTNYIYEEAELPDVTLSELGLSYVYAVMLMEMNDTGNSFEEIATCIEGNGDI